MGATKLLTAGGGGVILDAASTATDKTVTIPASNTTLVGTDTTQTLTNKTLTTPNFDSAQVASVSGSAPLYMCRAWVNFNGTGTVAIRGSGNVSSITDNGTGSYTMNLTTAMPDTNFMVGTGPVFIGSGAGSLECSSYSTSYVSVVTRYSGGGAYDWSTVFLSVHR